MAASVTSEPPHWNLTVDEVAGCQLGQQVGELNRQRIGAVHRRREREHVELFADRLDHAPVVVADRGDVDARERVEVSLAGHVPVVNAIGAGHDQRLLGPFGHLVAHEDLAEKGLLGGLGRRKSGRAARRWPWQGSSRELNGPGSNRPRP